MRQTQRAKVTNVGPIVQAIPMDIRHIFFLLVVFILYVIFGGLIFMLLESPEEQIKRKDMEVLLEEFTEHIKQLNDSRINERYIRVMIHRLLEAQDNNLIDKYGNQSQYINWSFINSFFFAITVTTTIGYGHLTPSTFFGKIFCIVYALFGIPITGLLIGSLADRFGKLYTCKRQAMGRKHSYHGQLSARLRMLRKALLSLLPWFFVFLIIPAIIFTFFEEWTFLDGFYYCFVTLSTIGFGDFVAGSFEKDYIWVYKILVVFWIIFGLAYLSMVLNFITQSLRSRHISNVMHSLRHRIASNQSIVRRQPGHFKRQQSSPVVLFAQTNGKQMYSVADSESITSNNNGNSNSNNNNSYRQSEISSAKSHLSLKVNTPVLDPCSRSPNRRNELFKLFRHLKINKNKPHIQKNPLNVSCNIEPTSSSDMRHSNSLPELSVTTQIHSSPSIAIKGDEAKISMV